MEDYSFLLETTLLNALETDRAGAYYGIEANSLRDTSAVWHATWATLTAVQLKNPDKEKEINDFLDGNHDLTDHEVNESDWDKDRMSKFHNDLINLLK